MKTSWKKKWKTLPRTIKETPPELSPEKLDLLDQEAAVEELNRLSKIGVIEEFLEANPNGPEKRMDLREVYDWRYREDHWKRRCRIVAREYRAGASSTAETFSPTASSAAARLVLILHLIFQSGLSWRWIPKMPICKFPSRKRCW